MQLVKYISILLALIIPAAVSAENKPVNIRPGVAEIIIDADGELVEVSRIQDNANEISGTWARTSRPCPSFCIQPMAPSEGVTTVGELEILEVMQNPEAILVDSRVAKWYYDGTLPGAVHIPYTEAADRLDELGCEPDFDGWLCEDAKNVALFCNGPWCGQSPTAIRAMIKAGFPAEKISYYRGGMQVWRVLGLTVIVPKDG